MIFGRDLTYNFDRQTWEGHPERSYDPVVRRARDRFTYLVKNTYRVLLSRGLKGCYVYFMDKDTERFFRSRMEGPVTWEIDRSGNLTMAEERPGLSREEGGKER